VWEIKDRKERKEQNKAKGKMEVVEGGLGE
jgi:hypothetical protein